MTIFSPIILLWYVFPILAIFAGRFLVSVFSLNTRFHVKASDLAVPFLIYGTHKLSQVIYGHSIAPYFFLSIFTLGIGLAFFQAYFYDEIKYGRYFKMYWRSVFLLTLVLYVALVIFSVGKLL